VNEVGQLGHGTSQSFILPQGKKNRPTKGGFFSTDRDKARPRASDYLDYLAGLETSGADLDVLNLAVELGLDAKDVGIPSSPCAVLGMGDGVPESSALAANITFSRHSSAPVE
jgi:hypothetical protein